MDRPLSSSTDDRTPEQEALSSLADTPWTPSVGPARFWLHVVSWIIFYVTVVIAWGQRNSWPDDLILCVLLLPLNALIIWTLYAVYGFGTLIDPVRGQQEQLIACLVLAVGIASGQLLLMNLGLVALATAWLRPARPGIDWTEWLKVPLVLFTALPAWLDFQGSRSSLLALFEDTAGNPIYQLPLALTTTQTRILGYCGLLSLITLLHGRVFWIAVPILPAFLVAVASLPRWFPAWMSLSPTVRQLAPWILGTALLMSMAWLASRLDAACRKIVSGETLRRWFEERRYPPWLAILVVAVAQTLPFDAVAARASLPLALLGMGLMSFILVILRWRSGRGPIHSRSVAMVAGALLLTLLAEFTTDDNLRRLSMGFVLIGLISWHCFWRLRVFTTAGALSIVILAVPNDLAPGVVSPSTLWTARLITAAVLLALLAFYSIPAQPARGETGYAEDAWVPSKRFALILLVLMMLFQTAAAFWPDHQMATQADPLAETPMDESDPSPMATTGQTASFRLLDAAGLVQVSIAYPKKNPYLIESPERTLQRNGWTVLSRQPIRQPNGEATALKITRDGQVGTAMWWFEQGPRSFSNHLYARRVLWSSWHLANRQLRQVRIESLSIDNPQALADFAARNHWFADTPSRQ